MNEQPPPLPGAAGWPPAQPLGEMFDLASFGQRFVGRLIDGLIPAVILVPIWLARRDVGPGFLLAWYLALFGLSILNDVALTTVKGGTVGKLIVGTRVVRLEDRQPLSAGTAFRRWLSMLILAFIPVIGILDPVWIFTGQLRQTLHDKFADTIVVRKGP